ncbi:glycosyltransferase family 4 protein [Clostridium sp. A1-XYC3]|uniref:Glycosyltransferase family 4 protein n=1 Tax=Clostridium tanneri TaxID=3037988 RepID=A0ABU4JWT1_9CLOT|nr:glycosyltransferase family 4 protein [Clostridium sp. A1-XYC3]MDW8802597.1 glycosyltransferase family 4 protein [Clostridium sp. A1-XYC3]
MDKVLIVSGTSIISGAEIVLKDYLENTKNISSFDILCSDINEIKEFYNKVLKNRVISCKEITPTMAIKDRYSLSSKLKKILRFVNFFRVVKSVNLKHKYDIIWANNTGDIIYSIFFKKMYKRKFIINIHDIVKRNSLMGKVVRVFDRYVDKYIAVSNSVKEALVRLGISENKIYIVYNGMIIENTDNDFQFKKKETISKIGFVGSLIERKDPLTFVEFIRKTKLNGYMVYNHYDTSLYNKIKTVIEEERLNIDLIGKLDRGDIDKFMKEMDFLFIPSLQDPLPTVVLESFKNYTPCIGRNIDGIPEMITEDYNGYLFNNDDDLNLISLKIANISSEKYNQLRKNSHITVTNKFNIKVKVNKIDEILFVD